MRIFLVSLFLISLLSSKAQQTKVNEQLEEIVYEAYDQMKVATPNAMDPLAFNAKLIWAEDKKQLALVLKVNMMDKWHIYAYAEGDCPFIMTRLNYTLPKEAIPIGDWVKSDAVDYSEGIHVYEGELYFFRFFNWQGETPPAKEMCQCSIYYQTCNSYQCLPPNTKTVELSLD